MIDLSCPFCGKRTDNEEEGQHCCEPCVKKWHAEMHVDHLK
ncbi:MAG: hypothetical protein ABIC95_06240 [archaeon]